MKILIIGGNRFFGLRLAKLLLADGHEVTLLNRGNLDDGLGDAVVRLRADRSDADSLTRVTQGLRWDLVYDQVCYNAAEARLACKVFADKTPRYVVTSTESVYDFAPGQREERFNAKEYAFDPSHETQPHLNYQMAKRQMEAVFARGPFASLCLPRPSLVVGLDDYSGRLRWHVERVRDGRPMFFPDLDVGTDFITSDQLAEVLKQIGLNAILNGPVNCTTPGHVVLRDFVAMCERATGKKAQLARREESDNHSPYGNLATKTMDTLQLQQLGIDLPASAEWMEDLVTQVAQRPVR